MASINTYLSNILTAVYGEDVRRSIHDAISAMNTESLTAASQSTAAQTAAKAAQTAAQTAQTAAQTAAKAAEAAEKQTASAQVAAEAGREVVQIAVEAAQDAYRGTHETVQTFLPYIEKLEVLFSLLDDYTEKDLLTDSKGDMLLDSAGYSMTGVTYGVQAFILHGRKLEERICCLEAFHNEYFKYEDIIDSQGGKLLDNTKSNISSRVVYAID